MRYFAFFFWSVWVVGGERKQYIPQLKHQSKQLERYFQTQQHFKNYIFDKFNKI